LEAREVTMLERMRDTEHVLTTIALTVALFAAAATAASITGDARSPMALALGFMAAVSIFVNTFGIAVLALLLPFYALRQRLRSPAPPG
jgi:type IV secretory pathway VirB3-like protein